MSSKYEQIRKFSTKSELESIIGKPKFQINNRFVFYYGNGLVIAYAPRRFRIEGTQRIEYGEEGMYAVSLYHYIDVEMLETQFRIGKMQIDDIVMREGQPISEKITYGMSFQDIHRMAIEERWDGYREGETRIITNGKAEVQNLFIMYEDYTLYFKGDSPQSKLSGYQLTL